MTSPTTPTAPETLGRPGDRCASCRAPLAQDQRYCLNCGLRRGGPRVPYDRLLATDALAQASPEPPVGAAAGGGGARTISPLGAASGLGLLLLAVIAGALLGGRGDEPAAPQQVVTMPAAATTPATTPATFVSDWTEGDAWTVQLQTLPKAETTPEAVAAAKQAATTSGATDVGALDSSEFASLDPDLYVIYSGRFDDKAAAKKALKTLKASFPEAKVVEVSTTAADDAATTDDTTDEPETKTSDSELKELENASPDEYVKKSRKLPDELGTEGDAPPVDNAAPGGGSEAAEIG